MTRYVYDFTQGSKEQKALLGGKGANLAEMTRLGLPVPPGFTITTEACREYLQLGDEPGQLRVQVTMALRQLEDQLGRRLGDRHDVLVQWRSDHPNPAVSLPPSPAAEPDVETYDEVMDASGSANTDAEIASEAAASNADAGAKVDTNAWMFAELSGFVKTHLLPPVVLGIATWLISLQVLRRRRERADSGQGG